MKKLLKSNSLIQFFRYAVVGCLATGSNYMLFYLFYKQLDLHYLISSAMAFALSVLIGFLINKYWTFNFYKAAGYTIVKYFIVYTFSLIISICILHVLVEKLVYHPELANIFTIGFTAMFNYLCLKFIVFKKNK